MSDDQNLQYTMTVVRASEDRRSGDWGVSNGDLLTTRGSFDTMVESMEPGELLNLTIEVTENE